MQTPYHVQILQKVTTFLNETKVPVDAYLVKEFEDFFEYITDDEFGELKPVVIPMQQSNVTFQPPPTPTPAQVSATLAHVDVINKIAAVNKDAALTHAQQGAKDGIKIG